MTVKMNRDPEQYPEPHEADVHPDEVDSYRLGGFVVSDPLDHDGDGKKGGAVRTRKAKATEE